MAKLEILVRPEIVCGREMFYPQCQLSSLFVKMGYRKTGLTLAQIVELKNGGIKIVYSGKRSQLLDELGIKHLPCGTPQDEGEEEICVRKARTT